MLKEWPFALEIIFSLIEVALLVRKAIQRMVKVRGIWDWGGSQRARRRRACLRNCRWAAGFLATPAREAATLGAGLQSGPRREKSWNDVASVSVSSDSGRCDVSRFTEPPLRARSAPSRTWPARSQSPEPGSEIPSDDAKRGTGQALESARVAAGIVGASGLRSGNRCLHVARS